MCKTTQSCLFLGWYSGKKLTRDNRSRCWSEGCWLSLGAGSSLLGLLLGSLLLGLFVDPVVEAATATCDLVDVELKARDCALFGRDVIVKGSWSALDRCEDTARATGVGRRVQDLPKVVLNCVYSSEASVRIKVPKLKSATGESAERQIGIESVLRPGRSCTWTASSERRASPRHEAEMRTC